MVQLSCLGRGVLHMVNLVVCPRKFGPKRAHKVTTMHAVEFSLYITPIVPFC